MFYEIDNDGYVEEFGKGQPPEGGREIDENRYNALISSFSSCPTCEKGFFARLNTNVEWAILRDSEEEPSDSDKAEAFDILMGESV